MDVKVLPSAEKDLDCGFVFYEQREIGVGNYFLKTLRADMRVLSFSAGIHSKRGKLFRMKSKKFPHWIYYGVIDSVVYVSAVLEARRSPSFIHRSEKQAQFFIKTIKGA